MSRPRGIPGASELHTKRQDCLFARRNRPRSKPDDDAASYKDGVWLVELAGVTDPAVIGHAVAPVPGIAQQQGKSIGDSIVGALTGRQVLIVLDSCEHLIEASDAFAGLLLTHCKDVRLYAVEQIDRALAKLESGGAP